MKKSLSLLLGAMVPSLFLVLGACGDDVVDAEPGDEDTDADASRRDATPVPPPRDARADGDADTGVRDSGRDGDADSSDGDADVEVPQIPPITFVEALTAAYCTNYDACCAGCASEVAATCLESAQTAGFFSGLLDAWYLDPGVEDNGNVRVDAALMTSCLADVAALGCINVEDDVPAEDWKNVLEHCSGALYGVLEDGTACLSDIECSKESACRNAADGGAGRTCQPLSPLGGTGEFTGPTYSDSCSYRGFGAGTERHLDATDTCQPLKATGERCREGANPFGGNDVNCASRACSLDAEDETATGAYCDAFKNDLYICDSYSLP